MIFQPLLQERNDKKIFVNATQKGDVSECLEIKNIKERSQCVYQIASEKNVPSACEYYREEGKTDEKAIGGCYKSVATLTNNWELCNSIKDYDSKSGCLFEKCTVVAVPESRDQCYLSLVMERKYKDIFKGVCDFISDVELKNQCYAQ